MGLRLWRDPDDEPIPENTAAKLDRAAAARRSTIRREPSVRPGRDHVPQQSISFFLRSRHQDMLRTRDRLRQEERETDSQIAQLQAELERLRRNRVRTRLRLHDELEASRAGRDSPDSNSPTDQLSPDENVSSHTEVPLDSTRHPLPRPPRESNLRFELLPSTASRSSSPWRYPVLPTATMLSPPRSSGSERRDASIPDGPIPGEVWSTDSPSLPALTEGFAPARPTSNSRSHPVDRQRLEDDFQGLETPPPESWESSYPPLHRVSHSSPRPPLQVDGLGDRRRSLSPSSQHNEEDTWMSNLLTTMDTSQSSSSSFTSSRNDGIRRSYNSSQTTSTSFGEIGSLDDTCELDLPEGITEDDVREIRERHSSRLSLDDPRLLSAFASIRVQMNRDAHGANEVFEAIVERLFCGERVPNEWWEAIGLSEFGRRFH